MSYFVTGATGFIGRNLVEQLLEREGTIYVLVRDGSRGRLEELRNRWGAEEGRIVPVVGDLSHENLGCTDQVAELRGNVDHCFHLAAIYDMTADAESQRVANVEGTRNAVELAGAIDAKHFHMVSSIAAAGLYEGTFTEGMFDEATKLDNHPYFATKHESEAVVRDESEVPWRVYRPGIVVGHSETGEIDKVDGPYYFFKLIQRARDLVPQWFPGVGIEGREINLVPVDFVAQSMDHIAHRDGLDGKVFHLTDPKPLSAGQVINAFAKAAHAPEATMRIDSKMIDFIPKQVRSGLQMLPPVKRITDQVLADLGIPREVLVYINYPTSFDSTNTQEALKGTDISVPPLPAYSDKLWDYWERNLDPDLFKDRSLSGAIGGKTVLITGASSGIGKAAAVKAAAAGAKVLLVARTPEKLEETREEIEEAGGEAHIHRADLSEIEDVERMANEVLEEHGRVDVLVNNAGRSIRRPLIDSLERWHDIERTMALNYYAPLRLMRALVPGMIARGDGHVINVSTWGVMNESSPLFGAYQASKAALTAASRVAETEWSGKGVHSTTLYYPLVKTPMIEPTKEFVAMPGLSAEEAADWMVTAARTRPVRIAPRMAVTAKALDSVAPGLLGVIMKRGVVEPS